MKENLNFGFNMVWSLWLQVFPKDMEKDMVVLLAARASRVENQDAIDASIVGMLGDPKEIFKFKKNFFFFLNSDNSF